MRARRTNLGIKRGSLLCHSDSNLRLFLNILALERRAGLDFLQLVFQLGDNLTLLGQIVLLIDAT